MKKLTFFILITICFSIISFSQEKQDSAMNSKTPKITYMVGNAKVTVWQKQVKGEYDEFTQKTFKIEKVYKKGDKWETTNTFDLTELLQLKAAIDKAISEEGVVNEEWEGIT